MFPSNESLRGNLPFAMNSIGNSSEALYWKPPSIRAFQKDSTKGFDSILIVVHTVPSHVSRIIGVAETWGTTAKTMYVLPEACDANDPLKAEEARGFLSKYSYLQMDVRFLPEMPTCYEYPPISAWLHSLLRAQFEAFHWLVKCDDDVYVNVHALRELLESLENAECRTVPCYFGSLGAGRRLEKHLLGLNGKLFVMGGPCVVMSRLAYNKILPFLSTCMLEPVPRPHSDTLLARCFQKANVTAGLSNFSRGKLNKLFRHYHPLKGGPDGSESVPLSATSVPRLLDPQDFTQISFHAIKTREEMHNIHAQLQWNVRPLFVGGRQKVYNCTYSPAVANSGVRIRGRYPLGVDGRAIRQKPKSKLRTCREHGRPLAGLMVDKVYIISLNASKAHVAHLVASLSPIFSSVLIWPAVDGKSQNKKRSRLSMGENGIKESFSSLFRDALSKDLQNILVFEDDALLMANFSYWWEMALTSNCLSNFNAERSVPSVVLLGCTIPGQRTWRLVGKQFVRKQFTNMAKEVTCFDVPPWTYGAFAVLYDSRILSIILDWLENYDEPFDWVWNFLAVQGFHVSSLAPFLAIAELSKPSAVKDRTHISVRKRLERQRWNTSFYMKYIH